MKIAVLGSTGQTGRLIVAHALERGHDVIALARRPELVGTSVTGDLRVVQADVTRPESVTTAIAGADVVISGLGITEKQDPTILSDGARLIASAAPRVVWLTSLGMGATEGALGRLNGALLKRILRHEWNAKDVAGRAVRAAQGTTVYAEPLTDKPYADNGRLIKAEDYVPRMLPPVAPRGGIADLMVAEAEVPHFADADTIALFDGR
ncbi:NAD(P)-dependent oxidoreductase [Streptomyces chartreusis]|uniref:NAD(P)-dependent oxidoreductase n=1 Tax=Streptomyces chartreusis TaxID=1969 RepID=UPI003676C3D6